jgi:hypothetical protein
MTRATHVTAAHDRPSRRPAVRRSDTGPGGASSPLGAAAMLDLQRTAGNASVAALVAGDGPVVQRGLFDMLGGLFGGAPALQQQAAGLAGRGVQAGVGALGGAIGGPFGELLGGTGAGLGGVASNLVGGNTAAALSGLQGVGAGVATPFAQTAMNMLGGAVGGQAGGLVSGLGGAVGQGLTSIIQGGNVGQAGMGVLSAAAPGLQQMAARFLGGI